MCQDVSGDSMKESERIRQNYVTDNSVVNSKFWTSQHCLEGGATISAHSFTMLAQCPGEIKIRKVELGSHSWMIVLLQSFKTALKEAHDRRDQEQGGGAGLS